jgi:hypothetical protein
VAQSDAPQESAGTPVSPFIGASQPQPKFDPFKEIVDAANSTFKPLDVAVLDSIANQSNMKASFEGALTAAKSGVTVPQYVQKIAQAATLEQQLKENQDAQNNLQIDPTDPKKLNDAMKVLQAEMAKVIPKPGVQAPHVDKEAMTIGAIAMLLGAPPASVVMGLHNGAMRVASQQNEANQQNYQDEVRQQDKNVADAKFVVNQEGDAVTAQERNNLNAYEAKYRGLVKQGGDIQKAIQDRKELEQKDAESIQKRFDKDVDDAKKQIHQYYIDNGGWDKDGQLDGSNMVAKLVASIAARHHDKKASMGENLKFISQLQNELDVYSSGTKTAKQQNSDRNFKFKVDKTKWDQEFKGKTFDQRQEMFDKRFDEQVRQFEESMGRNITNDEWRREYQRGQLEISGDRLTLGAQKEKRLGQSDIGGKGYSEGIKPPTPVQKAKALEDIVKYQEKIDTFPDDEDEWTPAQWKVQEARDALQDWINGKVSPINPNDPSGGGDIFSGAIGAAGEGLKKAQGTAKVDDAMKPKANKKGTLPPASGTQNGKPKTVKGTPPKAKPNPPAKPKPNAPVVGKGKGSKVVGKYEIKG